MNTIHAETNGPAGVIYLDRPEKLNALTMDMAERIGAAILGFETMPDIRGIVLTGSDRAFSTGADLNEALEMQTPRDSLRYAGAFRKLGQVIEASPLPVIAAISGYCITGGLEVALMCDIRLAAPNAVFGITSAKIGSIPGMGGTQRLPRLIGPARAMEMLFLSEYIDAAEAFRIGLVNRVVDQKPVKEAAIDMCGVLAKRGPLSVGWLKSAVNTGANLDLESALVLEAHLCATAYMTEDRKEGMSAFLEKRQPMFKGS